MVNTFHISYIANDRSYFANIKKQIRHFGTLLQLPPNRISEVDLIVAELTSNLLKHSTNGGEILAGCGCDEQGDFLQIIGLDNGPGFSNIDKVMADGYSTTGTLGAGLGSIKRLSDVFDICTQRNWGTIIISRVYKKALPSNTLKSNRCTALVVAKSGETCSGDGYYFQQMENGFKVLHADGLGHGPEAKYAVDEAIKAFVTCSETAPAPTINYLHERILKTRGIVANVVFYNAQEQIWKIAGVGNIATKWIGEKGERNYTPLGGIIGHIMPSNVQEWELKGEDYQQFFSCSDGIKSRWNLDKCKSVCRHDPLIQAVAVYKEFSRRIDDASIVVCKIN